MITNLIKFAGGKTSARDDCPRIQCSQSQKNRHRCTAILADEHDTVARPNTQFVQPVPRF
jgi:hypothetical protein